MKVVLCFVCLIATTALGASELVVQTKSGPVSGYTQSDTNIWTGIPYAQPPVGDLRWADPVPVTPWTTVRDATQFAPGCPQNCMLPPMTCPKTQSEDCLALNVYAPAGTTSSSNLPVFVWIHGGRFEQGSIDTLLYDGSDFAKFANIIVVTIQYRLGALGFLTLGDMTGNYAIKDQRLAMKWVQDNIAAFGGNPNAVTIAGQSAGGMSVATHLISPQSKGLFHRAIVESNPLVIWYKNLKDAQSLGHNFAKRVGCDISDNWSAQRDCLRNASVSNILDAAGKAEKELFWDHPLELFVPFTPTLGEEVPSDPLHAWREGVWNDVPVMMGTVLNDALMFVYEAWSKKLPEIEYNALLFGLFSPKYYLEVVKRYPGQAPDSRRAVSKLGTEYIFYCPARYIAEGTSARGESDIYTYRFDHANSFNSSWGPRFPFCATPGVVCHASEIPYVFNTTSLGGYEPTSGEASLAVNVMSYWGNFVQSGNPNGKGLAQWDAYSSQSRSTMVLDTPTSHAESSLLEDNCNFWDKTGYKFG